jgi:enoyl-CoA hydratase/3-hydroxyacyl-CoA dehydrogenase
MYWADSLGSKYIYSRLEEWSKTYGDFFKPCPYLAERVAEGAPLVRNLKLYFVCPLNIAMKPRTNPEIHKKE